MGRQVHGARVFREQRCLGRPSARAAHGGQRALRVGEQPAR
jgi:hypothetical protein